MYERAWEGYERTLTLLTHPITPFTSCHDLSVYLSILCPLGEYPLALSMYERAWEGYERILGPRHEETLNAAHHLGDNNPPSPPLPIHHSPTHPYSTVINSNPHFLSLTQPNPIPVHALPCPALYY